MRLLLVGPPGAGKGTQGAALSAALGIPHVSSGALLRQAVAGEPASRLRASLSSGRLVADDVVLRLLQDRFRAPDIAPGYLLDGFPRTRDQILLLDELDPAGPDAVVHLDVPQAVVIERASQRGRADDHEAAVRSRLADFEHTTRPMIDELARTMEVVVVDSTGPVGVVTERVLTRLQRLGPAPAAPADRRVTLDAASD